MFTSRRLIFEKGQFGKFVFLFLVGSIAGYRAFGKTHGTMSDQTNLIYLLFLFIVMSICVVWCWDIIKMAAKTGNEESEEPKVE
ncbi:MAG: hypothetical protein UU12_C0004G0013 [Candidatus Woesebacteria bacterium GW2011_GWA2_40_7b]|uniref:Uncharacterized protein n=1 Tax=Candidatus Woesebacteria bacterium GW2011_GWA2_40_7b TaxID=1618563 RepID=A0A0G0T915_9BACT|nr:MAG: hypothetical protein UU12_C0004G0013 [Candidatus Woesebacteria bacterium GW2011_GWA2_40_7b]